MILHSEEFENGFIVVSRQGLLKEWRGQIKKKRKRKIPSGTIAISRYFKGYKGTAYVIGSPDGGKTLNFIGTGPLTY